MEQNIWPYEYAVMIDDKPNRADEKNVGSPMRRDSFLVEIKQLNFQHFWNIKRPYILKRLLWITGKPFLFHEYQSVKGNFVCWHEFLRFEYVWMRFHNEPILVHFTSSHSIFWISVCIVNACWKQKNSTKMPVIKTTTKKNRVDFFRFGRRFQHLSFYTIVRKHPQFALKFDQQMRWNRLYVFWPEIKFDKVHFLVLFWNTKIIFGPVENKQITNQHHIQMHNICSKV